MLAKIRTYLLNRYQVVSTEHEQVQRHAFWASQQLCTADRASNNLTISCQHQSLISQMPFFFLCTAMACLSWPSHAFFFCARHHKRSSLDQPSQQGLVYLPRVRLIPCRSCSFFFQRLINTPSMHGLLLPTSGASPTTTIWLVSRKKAGERVVTSDKQIADLFHVV